MAEHHARSAGKPSSLKRGNIGVVLGLLRERGTLSVSDISEEIGLSKTTVKKALDGLVAAGLARSAGKGESTDEGGKKPELFGFDPGFAYVLCAHVTPDRILAATTDMAGDIVDRASVEVGSDRSLDGVLSRLASMLLELAAGRPGPSGPPAAVVVALPGLADAANKVSVYSPHYPAWGRDVPIGRLLGDRLGLEAPIYVDCVNRYQAIAERARGIARGRDDFMIIDALEEGIGGGMVLGGRLMKGSRSLSGEIGHMTLDPEGPTCICGNRGCFEALVSARRVLDIARGALDPAEAPKSLEELCSMAAEGNPEARRIVARIARWFALGISNVVMVADPELVILQGVYVKAGDFFLDELRAALARTGLPKVDKRLSVEYSHMGEDRGLIGGAAFAIGEFFSTQYQY